MALDRNKRLQSAERLLKQGKVQSALAELERLAEQVPGDPITLNRMGDLLAREGRTEEALGYYSRIADQFTRQGFYPKAIAIQKKILRLDANNSHALFELGELYVKQKLPGEAQAYFLRAAENHLEERSFAAAREVYEHLVAADPGDPRHRARLAEARAAEGDKENAAAELNQLGDSLLAEGQAGDAEKAFHRAAELHPGHPDPVLGLARCIAASGREDEALALLEAELQSGSADPVILGELVLRHELSGRHERAAELLHRPEADRIPTSAFESLFRHHLEQAGADALWSRLDPVLAVWADRGATDRLAALYVALGGLEEQGHIPALQRLLELNRASADHRGVAEALERLVRAYQARAMLDEASMMLDQLREVAPRSPLLQAKAGAPATEPPAEIPPAARAIPLSPAELAPGGAPAPAATLSTPDSVPAEIEAPAVPLNRSDEEFVTGRLTQAEILQKYGLAAQALDQVREVTAKFPGHEEAQQRLVALLRGGSETEELRDALVGLAFARRASGNNESAREAAVEAQRQAPLDGFHRRLLEQYGLLEVAAPAAGEAPDAIVIDFDGDLDAGPAESTPQAAPGRGPVRAPGADMLQEIRADLANGEVDEAERRVGSLRALGYASASLDEVAAEVARARSAGNAAPPAHAAEPSSAPSSRIDDDDLSTIAAALESELFADEEEPLSAGPDPESEQSLEEVFAAFKEHVDQEVDAGDHQTRYDLGIAYKEMGLVDEAIGEFTTALDAPELFREACVMLALCHRDRAEMDQAVSWYTKAIEASGNDEQTRSGLRYDLAEVLLQTGDRQGALDLFRVVLRCNPAYRDVRDRVAELESHAAS